MSIEEKKQLVIRTKAVIAHEDTLGVIIDTVANGGSLIDLCKEWDVRYSDVIQWVYADVERKKWYEQAIIARGEWFIQRVLKEIRDIGTVDIRDAYDEHGCLKPIHQIPSNVSASISGIETVEMYSKDGENTGRINKVRFNDKIKALELIGKNFYMFIDKSMNTTAVTVTHKVDQIDLDERIRSITHATVTTMEAQRIASNEPDTKAS